jgi:hypothetical protein
MQTSILTKPDVGQARAVEPRANPNQPVMKSLNSDLKANEWVHAVHTGVITLDWSWQ